MDLTWRTKVHAVLTVILSFVLNHTFLPLTYNSCINDKPWNINLFCCNIQLYLQLNIITKAGFEQVQIFNIPLHPKTAWILHGLHRKYNLLDM